jgi:hypothetical protein
MGKLFAALLKYLGSHPEVIEAGATLAGKVIDAHTARKESK